MHEQTVTGATASRRRRSSLLAVVLVILSLLAVDVGPAAGQSTKERLREAEQRASELQERLQTLSRQHSTQQSELEEIRAKISGTRREMQRVEERSHELKRQLRDRVRAAYRMGGVGFFQFLLSAESFRDFSLRVVMLERQSAEDEDLILQMRRMQAELRGKERTLEQQREEQANQVAALRDRANEMDAAFQEMQSLVSSLEGKVAEEERQRLLRVRRQQQAAAAAPQGGGGGGGGPVFNFGACPVPGPRSFTNDWGAPRGGGRRRHKGNDIFGPHGDPAAAVVGGRISSLRSGGLGGLAVYLAGNDGNRYYYAHMSGFAVEQGQQVQAGQTIAYIGNSGNARGSSPHVHFEVHPGGGGAVNPYPSLTRVC